MSFKIKTVMASDVPEALSLIMADKRAELLDLIIARCTVDEQGNAVDYTTLTLKGKMALVNEAANALADVGNG